MKYFLVFLFIIQTPFYFGVTGTDTQTADNQTFVNQTSANQTLVNQTLVNQTIANQTLVNQTLVNQTLVNQTLVNQTIANETIDNQGFNSNNQTHEDRMRWIRENQLNATMPVSNQHQPAQVIYLGGLPVLLFGGSNQLMAFQ